MSPAHCQAYLFARHANICVDYHRALVLCDGHMILGLYSSRTKVPSHASPVSPPCLKSMAVTIRDLTRSERSEAIHGCECHFGVDLDLFSTPQV